MQQEQLENTQTEQTAEAQVLPGFKQGDRITHLRQFSQHFDAYIQGLPQVTMIIENEGENLVIGLSVCSGNDQFDRKLGVKKCQENILNEDMFIIPSKLYMSLMKISAHGFSVSGLADALCAASQAECLLVTGEKSIGQLQYLAKFSAASISDFHKNMALATQAKAKAKGETVSEESPSVIEEGHEEALVAAAMASPASV